MLAQPYLESPVLSAMRWASHGFGTRRFGTAPAEFSTLKQIHSDQVVVADRIGMLGEGDALVTNQPNLAISIRTADCYPILLADAKNNAVAAVHAGWRGTAARIIQKTLKKMTAEFGTAPSDVYAAIDPELACAVGEVGEEVSRQFGNSQFGNSQFGNSQSRKTASLETASL